ncbi:MAG: LysM peptidoglycan-binding domain-containing protein [Gemmatimonadetes bacterium]|nr:LysM peptidoglycan-binding domain-containing protein [Gemmatimonadota bacterium]
MQPVYHTVARGETLERIARKYGTTVAALQAANPGVDPGRIRPGQRILVAGAPPSDSASAARAAPTAPPRAASEPKPEPRRSRPRSYTVRPGDTLSEIADRFGVSLSALRRANPGLDARRIRPGKVLRIPAN